MQRALFFFFLVLITSSLSAATKVYHKHGHRSHSHALPTQGLNHNHNGSVSRPRSLLNTRKAIQNKPHFHGERSHSHPLPKSNQIAHKHGNGATGSLRKKSQTKPVKPVTKSVKPTKPTKYICSNLTQTQANALYIAGHTYLDRDKDGHPCEPHDFPEYTNSSNCHTVKGYYRKNGSYVRSHTRCR